MVESQDNKGNMESANTSKSSENSENPMRAIKIDKITINIGTGKDQGVLDNGLKLIKHITGTKAVATATTKRIPDWGIRPGLTIGCKLTLRGKKAIELLTVLLEGIENRMDEKQFDNNGNVSFGIKEYIDIPSVKYSPDIPLIGLGVSISLKRAGGLRVKDKRIASRKIGKNHLITKKEAINFMKKKFNVKMGEEE
jgi:large subunit ribosomal protein L5|tara:strand:- start:14779 stop:15366 length:588 start_codon:yes stop_codon:yes gene_type:complete